jgi:hypothetical protein
MSTPLWVPVFMCCIAIAGTGAALSYLSTVIARMDARIKKLEALTEKPRP